MSLERIGRVLEAMRRRGLVQMLVSDPQSICYLTGVYVEPFERLFALYLHADGRHAFFMNRLFPVPDTDIETVWHTDTDDPVAAIAGRVNAATPLGVDKNWPARFLLPLMQAVPGLRCELASACVDDVRAVKDEAEQALMRENSRINDEVMRRAAAFLREGVTERACAQFILEQYALLGCEGPSFAPIVSFGANAADPHHAPDDTPLRAGECAVLDIGGRKGGYCSDMTRTYFCGRPSEKHAAIHDLVRRANEAARAAVRPGVPLCDVDRAARSVIEQAGYGEYFTHRLGHFIGRTEHEQGDVSSANRAPARAGMVFSIEPGVYLPGEMGVRVEDLVLVTPDGCETLNAVDRHY